MSGSVVPQIDLGALSLRSLSSFSSMLATFSADNVTPTAMIQMEALGSMFMTNGKHANRVPDLLQRYGSVRLDRLACSVGWRKGDSASVMAQSAGGQAAALMCLALGSIYVDDALGDILSGLSERLLSKDIAIASTKQLVTVARVIETKLAPLAFGNHLAQQVMHLHKIFQHLGKPTPKGILESISGEAMTDLLGLISEALREENTVLRISGIFAAGYILSALLMLFPNDTLITVDGFIIVEGSRRPCSIVLELISEDVDRPTLNINLETYLEKASGLHLPITISSPAFISSLRTTRTFLWQDWVSDSLTIAFSYAGVHHPHEIIEPCCNLIVSLLQEPSIHDRLSSSPGSLAPWSTARYEYSDDTKNWEKRWQSFIHSLGPQAQQRAVETCQIIARTNLSQRDSSLVSSYQRLCGVFESATNTMNCDCGKMSLHGSEGFRIPDQPCARCSLWIHIGLILFGMFWSLFVSVGEHTTISRPAFLDTYIWSRNLTQVQHRLEFLNRALGVFSLDFDGLYLFSPPFIHENVLSLLCGDGEYDQIIACGTGRHITLPSALLSLELGGRPRIDYVVLDGNLMVKKHCYTMLKSSSNSTLLSIAHDTRNSAEIVPSDAGGHSSLQITLREKLDFLELKALARVSGSDVPVHLLSSILNSYEVVLAEPCSHDPNTPLDSSLNEWVRTASVADFNPDRRLAADSNVVSIAMTKNNPEARLLCCSDADMLFAQHCCLNCAYHQLVENHARYMNKHMLIIV